MPLPHSNGTLTVADLEREMASLFSRLNILKQQEKTKLEAGVKRENRKKLGFRVHTIRLTDQVLIEVCRVWLNKVNHTDNPALEDILLLRKMVGERTKQNLEMLCVFWLRNEYVALRKATKMAEKR